MNTPIHVLNKAICESVRHFNWTRISVLAADGPWSRYIQGLWSSCMHEGVTIATLQKHAIPSRPHLIDVEAELRFLKRASARVIVLVTDMIYAPRILSAAYESGLLEAGYAWVIVDIHERFVS
eukprot:sb/3475818/